MRNVELQHATSTMLNRYATFASYFLTLTMRDGVGERAAFAAIRIFIARLNYAVHGRRSRKAKTRDKCQIVAIPVIEGLSGNKRVHAHVMLGNIPGRTLEQVRTLVERMWDTVPNAQPRIDLEAITDAEGTAFYMAKEVGFCNDDAVGWNIASIPAILHSKRPIRTLGQIITG
ncbi:hypothetical protein ACOTHT_20035 [Achromobacter xylosoxidans]